MRHTLYHSILRVSTLTTALILLLESGMLTPVTKHVARDTTLYLAQGAGVFAQIEPNELNTITAELTKREAELDEREQALRTIEARQFGESSQPDYTTYVLSVILFFLTVLIIMNYVLDWNRARRGSV